MTKKDYILIANVIKNLALDDKTVRADVAGDFARALQGTNPRFDVERFLEACGVECNQ